MNNRPALEGRHLRGLLNDTADKLSRGEVVDALLTLFRAWPEPEKCKLVEIQRVAKVVPRLVGIVENSLGALDFQKSCLFVKRIGNA